MKYSSLIEGLRGGLIVSCQAMPDEPLFGAGYMAVMARAAFWGGAIAIRANGPADVEAIRASVDLPIIGLFKADIPGSDVRITPTLKHAEQIAQAGADIIAIDATSRVRPDGLSIETAIDYIHEGIGKPVLADVSVVEEGLAAARAGADFVATTLSGYTSYSPTQSDPDFELLAQLTKQLGPIGIPVIAEGRIATPKQAAKAMFLGAHAVVVGSAITRPQWITQQFSTVLKETRLA